MLLHLIRHGETDWNASRRVQGQSESRLSARGRQQASDLAARLEPLAIERVFCSSSQRTRETAELLFGHRSLATSFHDTLREIFLGPWEGSYYDDLAVQDPEQFQFFWNEPHKFSVPGAETFSALQQRGLEALQEIFSLGEHGEVAVVSHGALIKAILCHFEGRPLAQLWEPPKMHNCAHSILELETPQSGSILQYAGVDYRAFAPQQESVAPG